MSKPVMTCFTLLLLTLPAIAQEEDKQVHKVGTIDIGLVETTPVVFDEKLYRFESVRSGYHGNDSEQPYFRFIDTQAGQPMGSFAQGHDLGSAFVEDGKAYVFGTPGWGASSIRVFVSDDLEQWKQQDAIKLPGWELFNTSVCKADNRYIMAIEVGAPETVAGQRFTARFAESKDLVEWELLPEPAVFTKERYSACPTIRWSDGWFYVTYLEAIGGYRFETHIVRSKDLVHWQAGEHNPVLTFDDQDKGIASDHLTPRQVDEVRNALNRNNSDLDFVEFQGQVVLYYSWGDQVGNEYLAKAIYNGGIDSFLASFFAASSDDHSHNAGQNNNPPQGWTALFNGKDLEGWTGGTTRNPLEIRALPENEARAWREKMGQGVAAHWRVEDGELVSDGHEPHLVTLRDYGNFEFMVDWKLSPKGDSGIYLRGCPQVQIWDPTNEADHKHGADKGSGGLWNNEKAGRDPSQRADKPTGEWNRMWIRMVGPYVTVKLNGVTVVEDIPLENYYARGQPVPTEGPIHLQTHGSETRFRNVYIRVIDDEESNRLLAEIEAQREAKSQEEDKGGGE